MVIKYQTLHSKEQHKMPKIIIATKDGPIVKEDGPILKEILDNKVFVDKYSVN